MRVLPKEIGIWLGRLKKNALTKESGHHSVDELNRTMKQKGEFTLCLNWDICLLLPLDIRAPGSRAQSGTHHWFPWFSGFWVWTRIRPATSLGLQFAGWQFMGLLSFHSHVSQSLLRSIFLHISINRIILFLWEHQLQLCTSLHNVMFKF